MSFTSTSSSFSHSSTSTSFKSEVPSTTSSSADQDFEPHEVYIEKIADRWTVGRCFGSGSHGYIYEALDSWTGKKAAIKMAHGDDPECLDVEIECYKALEREVGGFARVHYSGMYEGKTVMVMERLGESLFDLVLREDGMSLESVYRTGVQMLDCLERVHEVGFLHRDVKPENMLLGRDGKTYLIDMGLAERYVEDGRHVEYEEEVEEFHGTADYAAINAHRRIKLSRRDDIESLGYALVVMYTASVPWMSVEDDDPFAQIDRIGKVKIMQDVGELCAGMGNCMVEFFGHVRGLGFDQQPDYDFLRLLLREGLMAIGADTQRYKSGK